MSEIETEAVCLSKAVLKLEKYGYIQTGDEESELDCEHFRRIAIHHARRIQTLVTKEKATHD
jgi:hypothetical protein